MLLADYIRSRAEWRKGKAEQHPDDARNARSARALHGLAEVVEAMEKTPGEADLIASIEEELSRRSGGVAKPGELVSREVSRYGFDTTSTGLRVELGDVEITAKLLVSPSDGDGGGENEFGYIASMAVDLSGPYDLRDVVADLLAGADLRPEALTVD